MNNNEMLKKINKHENKDIPELREQLDNNTNKTEGFINVAQYMFLVDNGDWTNAIQQAINNSTKNQKLLLPVINSLPIKIKKPIYLKSSMTWEGYQGVNSYNDDIVLEFIDDGCIQSAKGEHLYDITLKDIVFKYTGTKLDINNVVACQRFRVERCSFIGFNIGLKLTTYLNDNIQANNNIIENKIIDCSFYDNNYGFIAEGNGVGHVTDGFLTRCVFSRNTKQDASFNNNSGGWDINGCHFYSVDVTDYSLQISNMLNTVTNCYFEPSILQLKLNLNSSLGINIISNNKFMQDIDDSIGIDVVATQEQRSLIISNNVFRWINSTSPSNCTGVNIASNGANVYGNYNNSFFNYTNNYNCFNKYHSKIIDYNDNYFGINSTTLSMMCETSKINIRCSYGDLTTIDNIGSILIDYKNAKMYFSNGIKWCPITIEE